MNIQIDQSVLEDAVVRAVSEGIERGVAHYEIQKQIADAASNAIVAAGIVQLVSVKLREFVTTEAERIVGAMVIQIAPIISAVMTQMVINAGVDMGMAIQTRGAYLADNDRKVLRARLEAEIKASGVPVLTIAQEPTHTLEF